MKTIFWTALFLATLCMAQDRSTLDEYLPLPTPVATVNIVDDALAGSPIKFFGTADAYVKPISGDRMMVWIEENNLHFQNISHQEIVGGFGEVYTTDTKGNQYHIGMGLGASNPGRIRTFLGIEGSKHRNPNKHKNVYTSADYHLKPDVAPSATAHAIIVKFADGSKWVDESRLSRVPRMALEALEK
jgi:hypothetical protein